MTIFSNTCFFLLLQFALLMLLLFAIWRDSRPAPRSKSVGLLSLLSTISVGMSQITTGIRRGLEAMNMFEKFTGLFIVAIITIINKSVFDDNEVHWKHYSAAINAGRPLFQPVTVLNREYSFSEAEETFYGNGSATFINGDERLDGLLGPDGRIRSLA